MPLKETFDDVGIPINATITGATVTECRFVFTKREGTGSIEAAPVTCTVASNAATTTYGPLGVFEAYDFYEVTYVVKITPPSQSETTLQGEDTLKVWAKKIKVKFTSDGEDHKNAKFKVMRGTTKLISARTNDSGEWEGDLPSMGDWTVHFVGPWEKVSDTKATGRLREFKVKKQPCEAKFVSPDPDDPGAKIKQYVNLDMPIPSWTKATPHGNQVVFKIATAGDLGTPGTQINIKCEFGRESARTTPKPALLADGLVATPTEENSGKTFKGKIALGQDKTATFTVELGLAGGDTLTISIGSTESCDDASLQFENWRLFWYENWMPKVGELTTGTNFAGSSSAELSSTSMDYMKEALDQVFIEWQNKGSSFFDKSALTNLDKNVYPSSLLQGGTGTNKCLVLTMTQLQKILAAKAVHKADKRVVSMIWCDKLVVEMKGWNQTFKDIEGETAGLVPMDGLNFYPDKPAKSDHSCGGEFAIQSLAWKVTHWQDGTTWKAIAKDGDPGAAFKDVASERTLSDRADIEAHLSVQKTISFTFKAPLGTYPANKGYPGACLKLNGSKFEATGMTDPAQPTVEITADVNEARGSDNDKAVIHVKETRLNQTHTITFVKPGSLTNVGTDITTEEQTKIDTWIKGLCGLDLAPSNGKLTFEIHAPNDNDRRKLRLANVKAALPLRVTAAAPILKFPTPAKPVRIEVIIQGSAAKCGTNGAASVGNIWMCTHSAEATQIGLAAVLMHEMGHNMGQGYADKTVGLDTSDNVNFGRPNTNKVPGIEFGPGVPGGDLYAGKGHRGTHCAHGASSVDKAKTTYVGLAGIDCLMFGGANMRGSTKFYFCANCKTYIKGEDLSDIRKNWRA